MWDDAPEGVTAANNAVQDPTQTEAYKQQQQLLQQQQLAAMQQQLLAASGKMQQVIPCPAYLISKVIGTGGMQIKELEQNTGAQVQVDRGNGMGSDGCVKISGTADQVAACCNAVRKIFDDAPNRNQGSFDANKSGGAGFKGLGFDPNPHEDKANKVEIDVPVQHVGLVVGKQWSTISNIKGETGAEMFLDQTMDQEQPRKLVIWGEVNKVQDAERRFRDLLEQTGEKEKRRREGNGGSARSFGNSGG